MLRSLPAAYAYLELRRTLRHTSTPDIDLYTYIYIYICDPLWERYISAQKFEIELLVPSESA